MVTNCSIQGCKKKYHAKGFCQYHYTKNYREKNKESCHERNKKHAQKNKERLTKYRREHHIKNIEKVRKWRRGHRAKHKDMLNEQSRKYHHENRESLLPKMRIRHKKFNAETKLDVFKHYSNEKIQCRNCHIKEIEFLTLDHISGRKNVEHPISMTGYKLYNWLKKHDYPPICQVLCMNCNWLKHLDENKAKHRETYAAITNRKSKDKIKLEVFSKVSNQQKPECSCCGYSNIQALSLDHISGRKNVEHPKKNKWGKKLAGMEFWRWLKKHDYPPICQVYCMNCNEAKLDRGECPHQLKKSNAKSV